MENKISIYERLTFFIGKLVASHSGKIIFAFLLILALMVAPLKGLDTSTKMSDFFPENEFLEAEDILRQEFDSSRSVVSILQAESGNILDKKGLLSLKKIENAILSSEELEPFLISYDTPVLSVAGFVEDVIAKQSNGAHDLASVPDSVLQKIIFQILLNDKASALISDGSGIEREHAVVLTKLNYNMIERDDETVEILLSDIVEESITKGYDYTSFSAVNYNMQEDTKKSLKIILPIAIILMLIVLVASLKSFVDVFISILCLFVSIVISFGLFSFFDLNFSQMTFFAPIIFMVLGIDYAIHIFFRYNEYKNKGLNAVFSMEKGIRFIGVSIFLSAVTTSLAFASNGFSNIPAVSSFGIFLGIGILVSFLVMIFLAPSLKLISFKLRKKKEKIKNENQDCKKENFVRANFIRAKKVFRYSIFAAVKTSYSYPFAVIIVALLFACGGIFLATRLEKDMKPADSMAEDSSVVQAINIINEKFPAIGMETAYIIIQGDICEAEFLPAVEEAILNMSDDEYISKTADGKAKVFSILPYLQANVQAITKSAGNSAGLTDNDKNGFPDTREGVIFALNLLYENRDGAAPPGIIKSILSKGDKEKPFDSILVAVETSHTEGQRGENLLAEIKEDLDQVKNLNGAEIRYAGFVFERYVMIKEMTNGMIVSTILTIMLCAIAVMLLLKSLKFGIITTLPIVFVVGWIFGAMYLLGLSLNMVTATIASFTIGIGIDYLIHLLERYRFEKRNCESVIEAIDKAVKTTGMSLFVAATTTFFGFFAISFSKVAMFQSFGILSSLMMVFVLASAFVVFPAMLAVSEKIGK